jgi:DNA-binding transcriptional ArsR family regulator
VSSDNVTSKPATEPDGREFATLRDPQAIRALAHPVRMALIEMLAHTGTLTATQASEALGESPANCAFHLRTLAKYGFVEEAGGGKGRERPWRRTQVGYSFNAASDDNPEFSAAVHALTDMLFSERLDNARATLTARDSWPPGWRGELGETEMLMYLTPAEARQFNDEILVLLSRYQDRLDHPERRPQDALPVEFLALSYPLLHLLQVRTDQATED